MFGFSTNETMREQISQQGNFSKCKGYVNVVFAGWGYALSDAQSASLKHSSLFNEIMVRYMITCYVLINIGLYTQRRVQPDQCYFTVQITGINFKCSL